MTEIDIKDSLYLFLKDSELVRNVMSHSNGKLSKTVRPPKSSAEDIVISVLTADNMQIQSAYVNVNIYVKDLERDGQFEEDTIRLRELCQIAYSLLNVGYSDTYRFVLESQHIDKVQGKDEHFINNRLLYKVNNE